MESSSSNSKERELQQMQLEETQLHSKCVASFKELKSHLGNLHKFSEKEANASDFHNKSWQKDFKDYTKYEPETYKRNLLWYLDELDKLIDEIVLKYGELRMKEKEVQAIKEIEKRLKEREIQYRMNATVQGMNVADQGMKTEVMTMKATVQGMMQMLILDLQMTVC
ncbi:hypothetical protein Tco_0723292 [Tanacetum coccineum]